MVPSSANWVPQLLCWKKSVPALGYNYLFSAGEGNVFPTMYDFILNSQHILIIIFQQPVHFIFFVYPFLGIIDNPKRCPAIRASGKTASIHCPAGGTFILVRIEEVCMFYPVRFFYSSHSRYLTFFPVDLAYSISERVLDPI